MLLSSLFDYKLLGRAIFESPCFPWHQKERSTYRNYSINIYKLNQPPGCMGQESPQSLPLRSSGFKIICPRGLNLPNPADSEI